MPCLFLFNKPGTSKKTNPAPLFSKAILEKQIAALPITGPIARAGLHSCCRINAGANDRCTIETSPFYPRLQTKYRPKAVHLVLLQQANTITKFIVYYVQTLLL